MPLVEADRLFNVDEAAEVLGVMPGTLRGWIRDRKIDAYNIGGEGRGAEWRVSGKALNDFLDARFQPAALDDKRDDEG